MRILTVSNCPLNPSLGSGYVISGYADRLRKLGHDVVTLEPADYEWLPSFGAAKRLRISCGYSASTLRALRKSRYDIIELWGAESAWVTQRLASRAVRPLIIARSNGLEPHFSEELARHGLAGKSSAAGAWLNRMQNADAAFRCADALTTVSYFDRRFALAHGYQNEDRLLTLENPLPDDWLNQSFQDERPLTVGFFGSEVQNKGSELFIRTLPKILRAHPQWKALLVGINETGMADLLPVDIASRVAVMPFTKEREQLRRLYRHTAIVVMPSAFESFGLVAAEAMSCGCAVAASPTGFTADLKTDDEVLLIEERTETAWSTALLCLMEDHSRRIRIAQGGHARVQSLHWSHAVESLVKFYERLADKRTR